MSPCVVLGTSWAGEGAEGRCLVLSGGRHVMASECWRWCVGLARVRLRVKGHGEERVFIFVVINLP